MRKIDGELVLSATDLVNFLECEHLTALDRSNLDAPIAKVKADPFNEIIRDHGARHELAYLQFLRDAGKLVVDVVSPAGNLQARVMRTVEALASGADVIYQTALRTGQFAGYADFLERVEVPSMLGGFSYEVVDTKLSRSPKASYLVQLAFYSSLLADLQGRMPANMHVVLGDGKRCTYRVADYIRYYDHLRSKLIKRLAVPVATYPLPCGKCGQCDWSDRCAAQWKADDHLTQVANIRQSQVAKLESAEVRTLAGLGQLEPGLAVPKLAADTLATLRHQAQLQLRGRTEGKRIVELLPAVEGEGRGFERLPPPDPADLYFDMEGDPLEPGGLEYLFGVGPVVNGKLEFTAFWAHSREEEKLAFEAFMDFLTAHRRKHSGAHIYHYAAYEKSALRRLMSLHGTREQEVDDLLRFNGLVDLFTVVREALRTSEPAYSIKNIELFYRGIREGDVQDAGASIVFYENWRQTREPQLLADIESYNHDDVESTAQLHQWLLSLRPPSNIWRESAAATEAAKAAGRNEAVVSPDDRSAALRASVLGVCASEGPEVLLLTSQLIDFHRRAQKPAWWKYFDCREMDQAELIDDGECLGGLVRDINVAPIQIRKSFLFEYAYPEQDSKIRDGSSCTRLDTGKQVTIEVRDEKKLTVSIAVGMRSKDPAPPGHLGLGPSAPIDDADLRANVVLFARSLASGDGQFKAAKRLLAKRLPEIKGKQSGEALVSDPASTAAVSATVAAMDESYLVIQGPPGTGKTYTGSHVIVHLLKLGYSVGVSSNTHKAIHNLLDSVVKVAEGENFTFRGFKKCTASNAESRFESPCFDNGACVDEDYLPGTHKLFAGTAWAFAKLPLEEPLDYLFIDEAGQVSLGNVVSMGVTARNIVLLGDQMQLGQPIQGTHPGRSGESVLEYLLDNRPTVPPEEGVFLPITWRMHPDVCAFISNAVYDGRLEPALVTANRQLVLGPGADPILASSGIRFVPVTHAGNSQSSEEEAAVVALLYANLLRQKIFVGGKQRKLCADDILVVSPYNLQVNLLQRELGPSARVGTVDKFQGQEAAAVIVTMATSSAEEIPRDIAFLFSKNRLNVAISRAQCLALVVASPELLCVPCSTPEQMALVNTLCWVKDHSDEQAGSAAGIQPGQN